MPVLRYSPIRYRRPLARLASICMLLGLAILVSPRPARAQPIPVEVMVGTRYASLNVVMSQRLSPDSRFGFFHLNTLTMHYREGTRDDLAMQGLLFVEPVPRLRVTGGAFYGTRPGFTPTAGFQYLNAGPGWFVLLAPRITLEREPAYTVFSILRYEPTLASGNRLYGSLQALNTFDSGGHIKSYQWLRLGLSRNGTQFGLSANADELGPSPRVQFSVGLFVRREVS